MSLIGALHGRIVHARRVEVLARQLAAVLPSGASVVDVGCGDGRITAAIGRLRPDATMSGLDVLVRQETQVPVHPFDGATIPLPDHATDVVLFVDVLHHTADPMTLLREARRVARTAIVIKDHSRTGLAAGATLRFMDWIGNAPHGVALPYNYWTPEQWQQAITALNLRVDIWRTDLGLYPPPARWLFERSLHFLAVLATR
jgi:SAM-dependent methyltransferase